MQILGKSSFPIFWPPGVSSHLIGNLKLGYKYVGELEDQGIQYLDLLRPRCLEKDIQQYYGGLMMIYHGTILFKQITQKEQIQDIP